jgi:hydroxymethylpyrimidine/phosphomethylpyrimidine kinase
MSAITAGLAKGLTPSDTVKRAKDFVTEAIRNGLSRRRQGGEVRQ